MGKPLSYKKASDNFNKLHEIRKTYNKKNSSSFENRWYGTQVSVEKNGVHLYNFDNMNVFFKHVENYSGSRARTDWYSISIEWEKEIEDYKSKGLFGYYDTDYCKIDFDYSVITIHSTGKIRIAISLP